MQLFRTSPLRAPVPALIRTLTLMLVTAFLVLAGTPQARAAELVMVEERGCVWCARWNDEVAPEYPKTAEGRFAPLRRIDLHGELPDDLSLRAPLAFSPTFLLVEDGQELARIEGYPGEDFFWGLLGRMLSEQTDFNANDDFEEQPT